jgi:riboflavin biosynthesis pyrimidine reductase
LAVLPPLGTDADLLELYAHRAGTLRVNFVTSVDGAATVDGRSGGLSGPGDRRLFSLLRALCDVVLVGAGTVRVEGYGSVLPPARLQEWRRGRGLPSGPRLAVVSGSLALSPVDEVFTGPAGRAGTFGAAEAPLVLPGPDAPAERAEALSGVAEVLPAESAAGWLELLAARGLTRVLCEGGAGLFSSLLAADLVDDLCLTVSPMLAAGAGPGVTAGVSRPRRLSLVHALGEDGFLFLRYTARPLRPSS